MVGSGKWPPPTVRCLTGDSFSGADWLSGCLQSTDESTACVPTAIPNGVHYTENLAEGSWVLRTPRAAHVFAQLMHVDDAEKANWLGAPCAYHVIL